MQANAKAQDAKNLVKGKTSVLAAAQTRPQLTRPSTKPSLNLLKAEAKVPEKLVKAVSEQVDSEATIYFSPENVKPKSALPPNVEDFDSECGTDPYQAPQYAQDIFNYLKQREVYRSCIACCWLNI